MSTDGPQKQLPVREQSRSGSVLAMRVLDGMLESTALEDPAGQGLFEEGMAHSLHVLMRFFFLQSTPKKSQSLNLACWIRESEQPQTFFL